MFFFSCSSNEDDNEIIVENYIIPMSNCFGYVESIVNRVRLYVDVLQ